MPEFVANAVQNVSDGQNVLLTDTPVRCTNGSVIHRDGAGIITLRGTGTNGFARYRVFFSGNIAVPETGKVDQIGLAVAINGETVAESTSLFVPASVETFGNVSNAVFITVPKCCCYTVAIRNVSTQPISVVNANVIIERVA